MCAEHINDDFAVAFGKIDLSAEAEAFFRYENGRKMSAFFEDAKSFVIFVFMEIAAFGETVFIEGIIDGAGWTKSGNEDGNDAEDNEDKKSPPTKEN